MDRVEVRWEIEDGYAGKSRPQKTMIDFSEFEECTTKEEFMQVVDECVQADFEQMGFGINAVNWNGLDVPDECQVTYL